MTVYIGTSGWQYKDWRERVYPKGVPQRAWLEYYAERFQTVESNNAFTCCRSPRRVSVAVEFRHDTWFTHETRALLERRGAALCMADRGSRPISPFWDTCGWTYLRFHEGLATPSPCYGRSSLRTWAERLAEIWGPDANVWVYFNNNPGGCAVRDARIFAREVERAGLTPTRVPRETVPVG